MKNLLNLFSSFLYIIPVGHYEIIHKAIKSTAYNILITIPSTTNARSASFYYIRGINRYNNGDYHQAIDEFTKALNLNPKDSNSYYHRGRSKLILGDNNGAILDFDNAIMFNAKFEYAYALRGLAKEKVGNMKAACNDWQIASNLNYKDATQWLNNQCKYNLRN